MVLPGGGSTLWVEGGAVLGTVPAAAVVALWLEEGGAVPAALCRCCHRVLALAVHVAVHAAFPAAAVVALWATGGAIHAALPAAVVEHFGP